VFIVVGLNQNRDFLMADWKEQGICVKVCFDLGANDRKGTPCSKEHSVKMPGA
jgi:hypothetical protein